MRLLFILIYKNWLLKYQNKNNTYICNVENKFLNKILGKYNKLWDAGDARIYYWIYSLWLLLRDPS